MRYRETQVQWRILAVSIALSIPALAFAKGPKMKPEELVARHLEAIGPAEQREAVRTRVCRGEAKFGIRLGGAGNLDGPASFLTEGLKVSLQMEFNAHEYPAEQFRTDTQQTYVGVLKPGLYSMLGAFVNQYPLSLREGLLGSVLSTAWPLLEMEERRPKLKYEGLKEFRDRELLRLRYKARKDHGDLKVKLYFDPETFRHVASSYLLEIPATMGVLPETSTRTDVTRYRMEEWFGDFKEVDGLTLPTSWTIRFESQAPGHSVLAQWEMQYKEISQNIAIDPASFVMRR